MFACPVLKLLTLCKAHTLLIDCKVGKYFYISFTGRSWQSKDTCQDHSGDTNRYLSAIFPSHSLLISDSSLPFKEQLTSFGPRHANRHITDRLHNPDCRYTTTVQIIPSHRRYTIL